MSMRPPCNCYVRLLTVDQQFSIRYGAHEHTCTQYRPSGDPVDRIIDDRTRDAHIRELRTMELYK